MQSDMDQDVRKSKERTGENSKIVFSKVRIAQFINWKFGTWLKLLILLDLFMRYCTFTNK